MPAQPRLKLLALLTICTLSISYSSAQTTQVILDETDNTQDNCQNRLQALSNDLVVLQTSLDGGAQPPISLDFASQVGCLNTIINHLGNSAECLMMDDNNTVRTVTDYLNQSVNNAGTTLFDVNSDANVGPWFATIRGQLNSVDNSTKSNQTRGRKIWGLTYLRTIVVPSQTSTAKDLKAVDLDLSAFTTLHKQYLDTAFKFMQNYFNTQNETEMGELRSGFGLENFLKSQDLTFPF